MLKKLILRLSAAILCAVIGVLAALVAVGIYFLESRPDLSVWHTAALDAEFTANSSVSDFEEYLALEDRLFAQLDDQVYARVAPEDESQLNRYHRSSISDPGTWERNWNRTFEFTAANPKAGVLLLHGMSDSPYSMRSLGEYCSSSGLYTIGLRLPGHGTAPSGLVNAQWQDMEKAVILAMHHLREKVGVQPIFIVGYSNGGALALHYVLEALGNDSLPDVGGLVLISPEIGVTKLAAFATWQARLGRLLGLPKLGWNSILLEYDPFKYNSFAVNAGIQAHLITTEIQKTIARLSQTDVLLGLPPILAFQSVIDATVSTPALIQVLFDRLPEGGHELVLFDMNQMAGLNPLLDATARSHIESLLKTKSRSFQLTVLTNADPDSREVVARHFGPGGDERVTEPIGLQWPPGIYSLSHVALPFPPDDPLYGMEANSPGTGIRLGNVTLRGERGILLISPADLLRQRWNPFYAYLERRTGEFLNAGHPGGN